MDDTILKLKMLARTESTLARIHAQRLATQAKLFAVAIGLVLLTIVMLNVGAYELLAKYVGTANSAFIIAGANGLLAVILTLLGVRMRPGREEEMAREVRELVLNDFTADANKVKEKFAQVGADLQDLRSGIASLSTGVQGGISGLASFGPLISFLLDALKRRKK